MPGAIGPIVRARRASWRRSLRRASPAPGYCTLTATSRPSDQRPRWTWPIEAAAVGPPSSQTSSSRQWAPRSAAIWSRTVCVGIGGAESWRRVSSARYGAPSSSGSAASSTDIAWPNFMAPPLSSPRVRKSCSAVRCWISLMTRSAFLPPSRLPNPSALRPAYPSGSAARRAVRAAALRGRSFTCPLSGIGGDSPAFPGERSTGDVLAREPRPGGQEEDDDVRRRDVQPLADPVPGDGIAEQVAEGGPVVGDQVRMQPVHLGDRVQDEARGAEDDHRDGGRDGLLGERRDEQADGAQRGDPTGEVRRGEGDPPDAVREAHLGPGQQGHVAAAEE